MIKDNKRIFFAGIFAFTLDILEKSSMPSEYSGILEVFLKQKAKKLPLNYDIYRIVKLKPVTKLSFGLLYNLLKLELIEFKKYL